MQQSGIEAAIQELQRDVTRVQEAIALLKKIQAQRTSQARGTAGVARRRLSAKARRRISDAAKRRWAAARASTSESGKKGRG